MKQLTLFGVSPKKTTKKTKMKRIELFNDNYQNFKVYSIPHAQLIIGDVPYNLGNNAYASNPVWYNEGDNAKGESDKAGKMFFDTDGNFKPMEFMHFCSQMLVKEPKVGTDDADVERIGASGKVKSKAPCMVLFCAFEQLHYFIDLGNRYGFKHYIPLVFRKNFSAQVLKSNMKIVGNCEYGLVLYKNRLPKFNNEGRMIFNCIDWTRDTTTPKIHPTQKPVRLLEFLIRLFTDNDDVVIDPCAGSGSTLLAAANCGRRAYGFEIKKDFFAEAQKLISNYNTPDLFCQPEVEARRQRGNKNYEDLT